MYISKSNSMILKGGGILFLLIHHLFYSESSRLLYDDIVCHGFGLVNEMGKMSRFCVALFVFLSGYGVSVTYQGNWWPFLKKRLGKLLFNYWVIWLVFVPIGVFVFHRSFQEAYKEPIILNAVLDFFGVIFLTGNNGYNPTWWFMSCIITLYILYPLLSFCIKRIPYLITVIAFFVSLILFVPFIRPISDYLLPFLAGMFIAKTKDGEIINRIEIFECIVGLTLLFTMRNFSGGLKFVVDTFICIGLLILINKFTLPKWLEATFYQLGKHSMNIFFFHSFIFYYWFKDWVYCTRNPIFIFFSLLVPCFILSVIIEKIKDWIGFTKLVNEYLSHI